MRLKVFGVILGSLLLSANSFALTFSKSVSPELKQQFLGDLNFLTSIQGSGGSALQKQIFGGVVAGSSYTNFFNKRIQNVDTNDCGGGAAFACVRPFVSSNTMWIAPNYTKFSVPQVNRLSMLLHESRHTERQNANWGHVNCPIPFLDQNGRDIVGIISGMKLEGQPACDTTALGAYAVGAVYMKNVQKFCTNCTEKVRQDAQLYGDDILKRIIDASAHAQLAKDLM